MIPFNIPLYTGNETAYIDEVTGSRQLGGSGLFSKKCCEWIETKFGAPKAFLTTSCTHALELAALLCDIKEGDEIIMPSYTFVSTALAFVLRGAKIIFIDIRPDTMNMDETLILPAVTQKTKAIVPVHYAGISCEMDTVTDIAQRHHLRVIEDAAQGFMAFYKGHPLGTIGDIGCYSFHETKNFTMGEGGAFLAKDAETIARASVMRDKGTNRSQFLNGSVDKYTWVDLGSSYLPSELNAAYLYAQLQNADEVIRKRMSLWNLYHKYLLALSESGHIELPCVPDGCVHNAHMFYIKTKYQGERIRLMNYLKECGIESAFHYIPLHSSPAGKKYGIFFGEDRFTSKESERLLRLPLYYELSEEQIAYISECIGSFYGITK